MGNPCKTVQKKLFLQAVYEYTPCKNSISWRKTAQMSLGLAPLSPSSMLYVLYVLYGRQPTPLPRVLAICAICAIYSVRAKSVLYVLYRGPYSTYSTYSMDPRESGCSVACLVRYSTYSTYSKEPGESGCSVGCLVRYRTYRTLAWTRVRVERVGGHIAHIAHIAWSWGGVERVSASPNCASLGKARAARVQCQSGGLATICTRSVCLVCALKRQAPVSRIAGRCTRPSNSPPWRSPCRTRTFASRAQSP